MKIGVVGYGNLGRAAVEAAELFGCEIYGVFSRRPSSALGDVGAPVYSLSEINQHIGKMDFIINAGGSKSDLSETTPQLSEHFDVVDSFDLHEKLAEHIAVCDKKARLGGTVAVLGVGWDPGLFSVIRIYMAALSRATPITFWGRGVSQGHSQAIRTISGVRYAIEYTEPNQKAVEMAERAEKLQDKKELTRRICYVVAPEGEHMRIEREIKDMPEYFSGYETEVNFISESDFLKNHGSLYHKGRVLSVLNEPETVLDFSASFSSNPRFTASVLIAVGRAAVRMKALGFCGAFTMADIPPSLLLNEDFIKYM